MTLVVHSGVGHLACAIMGGRRPEIMTVVAMRAARAAAAAAAIATTGIVEIGIVVIGTVTGISGRETRRPAGAQTRHEQTCAPHL